MVRGGCRRRWGRRTRYSPRGSWCGLAWLPPLSGARAAVGVQVSAFAGAELGRGGHGPSPLGSIAPPPAARTWVVIFIALSGGADRAPVSRSGRCRRRGRPGCRWRRSSATVGVDRRAFARVDRRVRVHRSLPGGWCAAQGFGRPSGSIPLPTPARTAVPIRIFVLLSVAVPRGRRSALGIDGAAGSAANVRAGAHLPSPVRVHPRAAAVGVHPRAAARADVRGGAHRDPPLACAPLQPSGSIPTPWPARTCVGVLIVSSRSWCAPLQPLGSIPPPPPARTCVLAFIVVSVVRLSPRGPFPGRARRRSACWCSSPPPFSHPDRCRIRRRRGAVCGCSSWPPWCAPPQPQGSIPGPPPARTCVLVFIAAPVQPSGSISHPPPAWICVLVFIVRSFRVCRGQPLGSIPLPCPARTCVPALIASSSWWSIRLNRWGRSPSRLRRGPACSCPSSPRSRRGASAVGIDADPVAGADLCAGVHRHPCFRRAGSAGGVHPASVAGAELRARGHRALPGSAVVVDAGANARADLRVGAHRRLP